MRVREKNNLTQWFKLFLVGVVETAKDSIKTFDGILKLKKEVDDKLQSLGSRSNNAQMIVEHLYQRPVIDAQKAKVITNLSLPSVYKLIGEMEKLNVIKEITGGKRGRLYLFRDYIKLFK